MAGRIILCWVCEEQPAKTYMGGQPICYDCLEHFLPPVQPKAEYPTADVAYTMRHGGEYDA